MDVAEVDDRVRVSVSLCAVLRAQGRECEGELELAAGATLAELMHDLELPGGGDAIVCVNGKPASGDTPLADGDSLYVFLPVSGG